MRFPRLAFLFALYAAVAWLMEGCGTSLRGVQLSWSERNGDDPAATFAVYRDSRQIATTEHLAWHDFPVDAGTHSYYVVALDAHGNTSAPSATITISVP